MLAPFGRRFSAKKLKSFRPASVGMEASDMQAFPLREHPTSLRKLLPGAAFLGADDIRVTSCSCDTRRLKPGDLFAAMVGTAQDGHNLASVAVAAGCSAILAEHPLPNVGVPVCVVPSAREAYGRICQELAGNPSRRLKVVGVTGTNGKTTTSCLIARILGYGGFKTGILGTLGYCDGEHFEEATLTTPSAERLAFWLARMADNDCTHAVMEVSSHALDQARLAGMQLDSLCVTNVRRDHLDYHRTIGDYRLTKSKAFGYMSPEAFAVINADDPTSAGYLYLIDGPVLTIGIRSQAELMGTLIERQACEQTFLLTAGSDTVPVRTRMIGVHHVYNCLCATAIGLTYGIDLPTIVRALESVEEIPGRLQRIECGQPFSVFVDFAHTPDALSGSLAALR
ncbi:MAG: UDP-N-acetylmuramoyl-L-alanyl-D-glutamate--2,6-diaminopimelate ligase, partial [Pirellulales bacterium]|nr:UDP-N-acetylmuramoyl-L-alanyl-D-glutamate--2,6-diaminopimelate ligase [Pirellulales bacterium]